MRAEETALKLIARSEQSCLTLSRKLEKQGHKAICVQHVLSRLQELKLIDDKRFVKLWLESRLSRGTDSPRRLFSCLNRRGINKNYIKDGINAVLNMELELLLLQRFVMKIRKQKSNKIFDKSCKLNFTRSLKFFLKGEGFSSQAIEIFLESELEP
jgi:regulatory protein